MSSKHLEAAGDKAMWPMTLPAGSLEWDVRDDLPQLKNCSWCL